ncbi:hypothetical protein MMC25_006790 [Agyrium rufum]|nr:hypothetical protein [Agyrium rufum]
MKSQACQACAKRKDECIYAEVSQSERIAQLEALVRRLEGESEQGNFISGGKEAGVRPAVLTPHVRHLKDRVEEDTQQHGTTAMIVKEDGESNYLESSTWHSWNGKLFDSTTAAHSNDGNLCMPVVSSTGTLSALQSIICRSPFMDLTKKHPLPQDAIALWDIFCQRVQPLTKLSFNWELDQFRAKSVTPEGVSGLSSPEHAFVFAVYLNSVVNLLEDECTILLGRSKSALLTEFQFLCEQALAGSNILGAADLTTIKALAMYLTAGFERLNTRSLWSLMGALSRNAERCGFHRDGALLGLSPYETERRRRIWWQLQHMEMAVSVKSGSFSFTLSAQWDAKLPLNIEDEDITPNMREPPKEREGLTSMSYCLWTYWVLQEQRSFRRADGSSFGFTWPADKSLSVTEKNELIYRLQNGLNKRFVQHCDPLRPLDMLVQVCVRVFICAMRRLTLHPLAYNGRISELSESHRNELLDVCMQCLEYDVVLHQNPFIKRFRWRFEGMFQWSAMVYVLTEARRKYDTPKAERIWAVLADVYASNPSLSDLSDDRRKAYAVELMTVAWRAREGFLLDRPKRQPNTYHASSKPAFLVDLEVKLSSLVGAVNTDTTSKRMLCDVETMDATPIKKSRPEDPFPNLEPNYENIALSQLDLDTIAEIDFDAIDWKFWETAP